MGLIASHVSENATSDDSSMAAGILRAFSREKDIEFAATPARVSRLGRARQSLKRGLSIAARSDRQTARGVGESLSAEEEKLTGRRLENKFYEATERLNEAPLSEAEVAHDTSSSKYICYIEQ